MSQDKETSGKRDENDSLRFSIDCFLEYRLVDKIDVRYDFFPNITKGLIKGIGAIILRDA